MKKLLSRLILGKNENVDFVGYIKKTFKYVINSQVMRVDVVSILFFIGEWLPFAIAIGITTGGMASFMDLIIVNLNKYLSSNIILLFIYPILVSIITGWALNKDSKIGGPGIGFAILHLKTPFYLKGKTLLLKLIVSVFVLAGGFIAGREGPSFFLGVGLGEWLGKAYGFSKKFKNMLGLIGGGAFTGALLKAPLGSSIFAMELENTYNFNYRPFGPMIVASITSYLTFSFFRGNHSFIHLKDKPIWYLNDIPYIILMGLTVAFVIYVYTIIYHFFQKSSRLIPISRRPVIGTVVSIPFLIGIYIFTHNIDILSAPANMNILSVLAQKHFSVGVDIVFIVYIILITSLTLAFGIPGGLVLPVLIIGAAIGNIFGNYFPNEIEMFTLAGMGAALSAAAKTPLAAIVMVTEMSHDDVVIPMTAAVITSYIASFGYSLYLGLDNPFRGDLKSLNSYIEKKKNV